MRSQRTFVKYFITSLVLLRILDVIDFAENKFIDAAILCSWSAEAGWEFKSH